MGKYKIKIEYESEPIEAENKDEAVEKFWEDIENTPQVDMESWVDDLLKVEELNKGE